MDGSFGNDNLSSRGGADTILGGPGDDEIFDDDNGATTGSTAATTTTRSRWRGGDEDVVGGAGVDTVELDSGDDTVRLDDVANDGAAGETKNIHADVEVVDGGGGSDNLFGNAAANTLRGGSGNDLIDGGGGQRRARGRHRRATSSTAAPDVDRVVYSGAGGQTITLDDVRNDGAPGELDNVHADIEDVAAGPGNDAVDRERRRRTCSTAATATTASTGGGGVDTYFGGAGADTLLARDGLPERVECGPDADAGEADTIDLLVDCEGVRVSSDARPGRRRRRRRQAAPTATTPTRRSAPARSTSRDNGDRRGLLGGDADVPGPARIDLVQVHALPHAHAAHRYRAVQLTGDERIRLRCTGPRLPVQGQAPEGAQGGVART